MRAQTIDSNYEEAICVVYDWHKKARPGFCSDRNYKVVFMTSAIYTGNLGGVSGADQKCQDAATSANLTGTCKAWVADATSQPIDTFTKSSVPYVLLDGNYVVDNWDQMAASLTPHNAIDVDENGNSPWDHLYDYREVERTFTSQQEHDAFHQFRTRPRGMGISPENVIRERNGSFEVNPPFLTLCVEAMGSEWQKD